MVPSEVRRPSGIARWTLGTHSRVPPKKRFAKGLDVGPRVAGSNARTWREAASPPAGVWAATFYSRIDEGRAPDERGRKDQDTDRRTAGSRRGRGGPRRRLHRRSRRRFDGRGRAGDGRRGR